MGRNPAEGANETAGPVRPRSPIRAAIVTGLVILITILHYFTEFEAHRFHLLYQGLYFLPIILAGFWFALRGALAASLTITALYVPFTVLTWRGFAPEDLNNILEIVLYNVVALVVGLLRMRERREQDRLARSARLTAIGQAASAVAHDLKNPVIAMGGLARSSLEDLPPANPAREKLRLVADEAARLERLIEGMLDFSRPLELRRARTDLRTVMERGRDVTAPLASARGIRVAVEAPPRPLKAWVDADRLIQALINLLTNAIEASPPDETVLLSARRDGRNAILTVADHGPGIPPPLRRNLFAPFFSGRKDGTGLGLAIARKIADAHGGRLEIVDTPDHGATLRLVLPLGGG